MGLAVAPVPYVLLLTLAEAKLHIGKTSLADDVELQSFCDSVVGPMEDFCGVIVQRPVSEFHTPRGAMIVLRQERYASITSITSYEGVTPYTYTQITDPTTAGARTFIADPVTGILERVGSSGYPADWTGRVKADYVAGFGTIPANLNLAARMIVQEMWRSQQGNSGLPTLGPDEYEDVEQFDAPIPRRALLLMEQYRRGPSIG